MSWKSAFKLSAFLSTVFAIATVIAGQKEWATIFLGWAILHELLFIQEMLGIRDK